MIRMRHPQHGFHNAMPHEVEVMQQNGWTVERPEASEKAVPPSMLFAEQESMTRKVLKLPKKADK